jgi:hypothetical protein
MTTRRTGITLQLSGKKKKPSLSFDTLSFTQSSQQVSQQSIYNIPDVRQMVNIPGIQPFLIPSLIPDLIWLYKKKGQKFLEESIKLADPNNPNTIIFNNTLQNPHKQTQKVEIDIGWKAKVG